MTNANQTLTNANMVLGVANAVVGKIFPVAGVVICEAAVVTQSGVSSIAISEGRNVSETAIPGVSINGSIIAQTAKVEALIVALARAALAGTAGAATVTTIGVAGLTIGLTLIAATVALSSNLATRDILTDPDFWDAVGSGAIENYLRDRTGIDLSDLARALWESFWNGDIADFKPRQSRDTNDGWQSTLTPRAIDPLAIDLDADGIETLGIPASGTPILFDHNGDGVKTGTGWLRPDDAWLVRDLSGNGLIDGGHELFGVDTVVTLDTVDSYGEPITYSRMALNGFDALRGLDANRDGLFNAADAAWGEVQLWQDLNGDAISQAGELSSLASRDIIGISLTETVANQNLGNGNSVTGTAVVQRSAGGNIQVAGVNLQAGNLNLADNPFYREFSDTIALTEAAAASPEMGGSGWLRDLRQAASLGTTEAATLQGHIDAFAAASSRSDRMAGRLHLGQGRRTHRRTMAGVKPRAQCRRGPGAQSEFRSTPAKRNWPADSRRMVADAVIDPQRGAIFAATLPLSKHTIDVDGKAIRLTRAGT